MKGGKMTTIEMEIAIMRYMDIRKNIIVPNVSWGIVIDYKTLHECDLLILSKSGYATEIEIKISKSDLKQDIKKLHKHKHNAIKKFYFAVPVHLKEFALDNIPKHAGLIVVNEDSKVEMVKTAEINKYAIKWKDKEKAKLLRLGCMRILGLKEKIVKSSII